MQYQGKWRPSERESGGRGGEEWGDDGGQRWEEEEVDPEDLHGPAGVQNGAKEDAGGKGEPSERARQQSGRVGGGGGGGGGNEGDQEPPPPSSSALGADWDSAGLLGTEGARPPAEPPKHKTSGDHLEYMAGNLVDSLVNEPEEVNS